MLDSSNNCARGAHRLTPGHFRPKKFRLPITGVTEITSMGAARRRKFDRAESSYYFADRRTIGSSNIAATHALKRHLAWRVLTLLRAGARAGCVTSLVAQALAPVPQNSLGVPVELISLVMFAPALGGAASLHSSIRLS